MINAEQPKRNPQITLRYRGKEGQRLHVAADMGFGDSYWAKIKSGAIVPAMLDILPLSWIVIYIKYDQETAFTKYLERVFEENNLPLDYVVIRISAEDNEGIDSCFFIHHLRLQDVAEKFSKYSISDSEPFELHYKKHLQPLLMGLFRSDFHPNKPGIRRWGAARHTQSMLRLARLRQLIRMAREGQGIPVLDNVPPRIDFIKLLIRLIKNDKPLIYNMKIKDIFRNLIELAKEGQLTRDQVISVIRILLESRGNWEKEGFYKGLPKHGAEGDKKQGRVVLYEGKHSALTVLLRPSEGSAWDTFENPEIEAGEEFIE